MKINSLLYLVTVLSLSAAAVLQAQSPPQPQEPPRLEAGPTPGPSTSLSFAQSEVARSLAQIDQAQAQADAQMKQAQEQFDQAQKLLGQQSLAWDSSPTPTLSARVQRLFSPGTKALVIRISDPAPAQEAGLEEDLAVMSHILTKAVEEKFGESSHGDNILGIAISYAPGSSGVRSLYLEGYGALFMLSVDFPLLPPPSGNVQKEKTETDSTWEAARQELYGDRVEGGAATEAYDKEKVKTLKEILLQSLKNATNIRGVKPDEGVTICVTGGSAAGKFRRRISTPGAGRFFSLNTFNPSTPGQSILTLRAKKSDIDALAKGKLSLEDFQKRVQIATYAGSSEQAGMTQPGAGGFWSSGGGSSGAGNIGGDGKGGSYGRDRAEPGKENESN